MSFQKKILWIFDPEFSPLAFFFGFSWFTLYDCVDYVKDPLIRKTSEFQLLKHANLVTTNSHSLFNLHKHYRKKIYLVPQGFRYHHFKNPYRGAITLPQHKIKIGFIGGINSRIDFNLLFKLIKKFPQYLFVFAGQIQSNPELRLENYLNSQIHKLFTASNCLYLGNVEKTIVPSLIQQFDICIIPYKSKDPFNKYCYPMKLFEYFYQGKPVISTPIKELKNLTKYVRIGSSEKDWERNIKETILKPLSLSTIKSEKRMAIDNSWDNKISQISQLINYQKNFKVNLSALLSQK